MGSLLPGKQIHLKVKQGINKDDEANNWSTTNAG
jgi:hypothetical protein